MYKRQHKFFGSKEHKAKVRGFVIGQQLLQEAADAGVEVVLNATVIGMYLAVSYTHLDVYKRQCMVCGKQKERG